MERKTFIDVAKGIAMLLVVMQHTGGMLDSGMRLLCKVDVPLFFVCSGYLAYKNHIDFIQQIKKYINRIFIPFVVACMSACIFYNENVMELFTNIGKRGYWFLQALFLMLILFLMIYKNVRRLLVGSLFIELSLLLASKYASGALDGILGFSYMARYFPCLIVGALLSKYSVQSIQNRCLGSILLLCSFLGLGVDYSSNNFSFIAHVIGYASASFLAFLFIKDYTEKIPLKIRKALAYIGKYSLNIYIIHFYIVFYIPNNLLMGGVFVVDFITTLVLALLVTFISIAIGKILTHFTIFNKILTP